jgi:hypothetical protein
MEDIKMKIKPKLKDDFHNLICCDPIYKYYCDCGCKVGSKNMFIYIYGYKTCQECKAELDWEDKEIKFIEDIKK